MSKLIRPHNIFFFSVLVFVIGILLANWQINFIWLILATAIFIVVCFSNNDLRHHYFVLILIALLLPAGGLYHQFYNIQLSQLPLITTPSVVNKPADMMKEAYRRLLSPDQAGLLSGITLGDKEDLSRNLLDKLSLSGVRHLTALSGLHVSIIILSLAGLLKKLLPRKRKLNFIFLIILSLVFVILTGLRVSAMRAAFMAGIAGLSQTSDRIYSPRNSLAAAGFILLLFNPNQLVFDIGFQLSFLAVMGIVYISPILKRILRIKDAGFLNWKDAGLMTISAQVATAPLLIHYFSNFTFTSFFANVLILPLVPTTMILGYFMGIFYYLLKPIAVISGWLMAGLLKYQLIVIDVFSVIKLPFNPQINWWFIAIYYLVLVGVIFFYGRYFKKNNFSNSNSFIAG